MIAPLLFAALSAVDVWSEPVLHFPPGAEPSEIAEEYVSFDTVRGEFDTALLVVLTDEALTNLRVEVASPHASLDAPLVSEVQSNGVLHPIEPADREAGVHCFLIQVHATGEARAGLHESAVYVRADNRRRSSRLDLRWRVRDAELDPTALPPIHAAVDLELLSASSSEADSSRFGDYPLRIFPVRAGQAAQVTDYSHGLPAGAQRAPNAARVIGPVFAPPGVRGVLLRQSLDAIEDWRDALGGEYWQQEARVLVRAEGLNPDELYDRVGQVMALPKARPIVFGAPRDFWPANAERAIPWDTRTLAAAGGTVLDGVPPCAGQTEPAIAVSGNPGAPREQSGVLAEAAAVGDCCLTTGWSPLDDVPSWLAFGFDAPLRLERVRIVGVFGERFHPEVHTAFTGQPFTRSTVRWEWVQPGVMDGTFVYPAEFAGVRMDFPAALEDGAIVTEVLWRECPGGGDDSAVWLTPPEGPFAWSSPRTLRESSSVVYTMLAPHVRGLMVPLLSPAMAQVEDGLPRETVSLVALRDAAEDVALLFGAGSDASGWANRFRHLASRYLSGGGDEDEWLEELAELREELRRSLER